jgi:hypothetical protein
MGAFGHVRANINHNRGRLRYFLNRVASHPSKQQPYKNFRATIPQNLLFWERFFKKTMRKFLVLNLFLIFENFFELF